MRIRAIARFNPSVLIVLVWLVFVSCSQVLLLLNPTQTLSFPLGMSHQSRDILDERLSLKSEFKSILEEISNSAEVVNESCAVNLTQNNYIKAELECSEAIKREPGNDVLYLNRGLAHYRLENYPDALLDYNTAITLRPNQVEAYYNRGLVYVSQKHYREAIADFNTALSYAFNATSEQQALIYLDRGLTYLEQGNYHQAMADFNQGIHLDFKNPWIYYNRACACHQQGDYRKAIADLTQAIKLNSHQPEAYTNRGLIHYQLGYYQAALADWKQGAEYFRQQGQEIPYQRVLAMIQKLQKSLSTLESIVA